MGSNHPTAGDEDDAGNTLRALATARLVMGMPALADNRYGQG
ncbi:hypothetical protein [Nocardia sp. SC052]